jgi:hypothetical protein
MRKACRSNVREVANLDEHQNLLPTRTHVVGMVCKRTTEEGDTTLWGRETEGQQNQWKPSVWMYLWPPTQRHPAERQAAVSQPVYGTPSPLIGRTNADGPTWHQCARLLGGRGTVAVSRNSNKTAMGAAWHARPPHDIAWNNAGIHAIFYVFIRTPRGGRREYPSNFKSDSTIYPTGKKRRVITRNNDTGDQEDLDQRRETPCVWTGWNRLGILRPVSENNSPGTCEVLNQVFLEGMVTLRQTLGEMMCLPKQAEARQIEDFRPIILLNTDYKLLARIRADRLRTRVAEHLKFRVQWGPRVHDPGCRIDDTKCYRFRREYWDTSMCVKPRLCTGVQPDLSPIPLSNTVVVWDWIVDRRTRQSTIYQWNDISTDTKTQCGKNSLQERHRQGCPLSMILFALCIQPLLSSLESCLAGVATGRRAIKSRWLHTRMTLDLCGTSRII